MDELFKAAALVGHLSMLVGRVEKGFYHRKVVERDGTYEEAAGGIVYAEDTDEAMYVSGDRKFGKFSELFAGIFGDGIHVRTCLHDNGAMRYVVVSAEQTKPIFLVVADGWYVLPDGKFLEMFGWNSEGC